VRIAAPIGNAQTRFLSNGEPTLLVHCLYYMSPLNPKKTASFLMLPLFYVAKKSVIKRKKFPL